MPDNKCKWEPKYLPKYQCLEPPLEGDENGWCILHSEREDKDIDKFKEKVEKRLGGKEEIDLKGCYFPEKFPADYFRGRKFDKRVDFSEAKFAQEADFSFAKFSKWADFWRAKFSQLADFFVVAFSQGANFNVARFSQGANFGGATFLQQTSFASAAFSQRADFSGAVFSLRTDFSETTFSQEADFSWVEFSQDAVFFRAIFGNPDNNKSGEANFHGATFSKWAGFANTTFFSKANFSRTRFLHAANFNRTIFKESVFHDAYFWGERIRFQGVDLSNASFLHSNIDKVDFRYCEFNKDRPDPLFGIRWLGWLDRIIDHRRQNVLKDEIDADKDVGTALVAARERTGTSPVPTEMRAGASPAPTGKGVREEKYEPVRRLYLELKKNFEEKKDWNTAGDFHYGEMECRRKMKEGWLWRNVLSLEAVYFWLSGYGERPLKAVVSLGLLIVICAVLYMYFEGLVGRFDGDYVRAFLKSGCDSLKIATLQRIGDVYEPFYLPAKILFVFESIMGPILITLLALALRRRVKR